MASSLQLPVSTRPTGSPGIAVESEAIPIPKGPSPASSIPGQQPPDLGTASSISATRHGGGGAKRKAGASVGAAAGSSIKGGANRGFTDKDDATEKGAGSNSQKRRRRVFSCQSCQRLKCRCEYDAGSQACHRCVTLRIECSLKGEFLEAPPNQKPVDSSSSIEDRLSRHEKSLADIKNMLEFVSRQFGLVSDIHKSPKMVRGEVDTETPGSNEEEDPENLADPVDLGIKSAPTVVLREIGEQVTKGYRRLEHVKLDLIQLQLLDEQTANELVRLFFKHHGHMLLVYDPTEAGARDLREVSAFLHSVCCLCATLYRDDLCGTTTHRGVYEQVRITLGQVLLSSPLSLEEINAVLLMSDHADGPEYIDSWLLTGYCAKQAMLSISFSKIVNNIKRGTTTVSDRRAIHLWSTICLHHLHWAATTGRPSVLQNAYINQCNILLSFYQASMQNGMLVAEIMLYSVLHQKLNRRSYLDANSESSMLRIGYYAANLILAVRALEESGHAMSPKTFLSNMSLVDPTSGNNDDADAEGTKKDTHVLHVHTSRFAHSVLETFVDMPPFLMDSIPTYLCLCIGYSALILAHYDEKQSKVPPEVSIGLISRLEDWCMRTPSKSWAIKFAKLARQKVESRTGSRLHPELRRGTARENDRRHMPGWSATDMSISAFAVGPEHSMPPSGMAHTRHYEGDDYVSPGDAFPLASDGLPPGYEVSQGVIPSMEDFFGGGFLDFMRHPRG